MHQFYFYFMIKSEVQDPFGGKTNHTFREQHLQLPVCIGAEGTILFMK